MASLGHIAVGIAAARVHRGDDQRPRWPVALWWSALAMLPDADVIGFSMGVRYGDPWGHRGATHSLLFAAAVAAALGLSARTLRLPPRRTWLVATIVATSHGLLDTLTDGGLGCALLWPFDLTRYFAPWRPIPVAPIGLFFFSPYGFFVATTEAVLFAPLFLYGLHRRPRLALPLAGLWAVSVWLIASRDPVRESVLSVALREHTEYAPRFSEGVFRAIENGLTETEVRRELGPPIGEYWDYLAAERAAAPNAPPECPFVYLESDVVTVLPHDRGPAAKICADRGVDAGMSRADVERTLGLPPQKCLRYSRGEPRRYHRARLVCFADGRVVARIQAWEPG
jgi:inner membrane protein